MLHFLYTPRSIKLPVKHTLTLPVSYLRIHSFIVILLFSLHLFFRYALWNLAILATETNKCDLIWFWLIWLRTKFTHAKTRHIHGSKVSDVVFVKPDVDVLRRPWTDRRRLLVRRVNRVCHRRPARRVAIFFIYKQSTDIGLCTVAHATRWEKVDYFPTYTLKSVFHHSVTTNLKHTSRAWRDQSPTRRLLLTGAISGRIIA